MAMSSEMCYTWFGVVEEGSMEKKREGMALWVFIAAIVSQNVVIPVMGATPQGLGDQKNYYNTPSTPSQSHAPKSGSSGSSRHHSGSPPSHGGDGSYGTPSHGSSGSYGTPSHGSGGGGYGSPSQGGGTGSPPQGDGGYGGGSGSPPRGGGGYYHSSPTTPVYSSPTTPVYDPPTPDTPVSYTPTVPDVSTPGTPYIPDPNTRFPFIGGTCDFWRTHPAAVWGMFGYFVTVAGAFGCIGIPGGFGQGLNLHQALNNNRKDGFGSLYREGTASLLNSMVNKNFAFTPDQVKSSFNTALASDKIAAAQADVFKKANEGLLKPRA
ncbi:protodermal factor 1 [Amborella trichopoda]|uniref:protodermal factor 1 n=1 Tax=Amborella trichopoda TaxID=13333 RepID=UPI0009BDB559|nr:protodermal factor 1 [Amborella trichopoda]|eukprot:XP_011628801.2 protodermal factor 1 [Amborella trichopoda]